MEKELNWAVIGTGVIANEMAQALQKTDKTLYGVANRTQTKAIDFAKKYGVKKVYDEIDDVFDDENVDIIYLATSHNTHYQFMKKALEHGKHLFVEKSITLNSRELDEMMALAKEKLGSKYVLQGNMEPCRLYSKEETTKCVEAIQNVMKGEGHIFNLGHGILPDVPVENAIHFVKECQRVSKK